MRALKDFVKEKQYFFLETCNALNLVVLTDLWRRIPQKSFYSILTFIIFQTILLSFFNFDSVT